MTPADLTAWRETHALTKVELARLLGVQPLAVSRWEGGTRSIPPYLPLALSELQRRFTT
jgi:DNA-binding transcriptional regulator YiaG